MGKVAIIQEGIYYKTTWSECCILGELTWTIWVVQDWDGAISGYWEHCGFKTLKKYCPRLINVCNMSFGLQVVTCNCTEGWSGDHCDADEDSCEGDPCFEGVICFDDPPPSTDPRCGDCPPNFVGDGLTCYGKSGSVTWNIKWCNLDVKQAIKGHFRASNIG